MFSYVNPIHIPSSCWGSLSVCLAYCTLLLPNIKYQSMFYFVLFLVLATLVFFSWYFFSTVSFSFLMGNRLLGSRRIKRKERRLGFFSFGTRIKRSFDFLPSVFYLQWTCSLPCYRYVVSLVYISLFIFCSFFGVLYVRIKMRCIWFYMVLLVEYVCAGKERHSSCLILR